MTSAAEFGLAIDTGARHCLISRATSSPSVVRRNRGIWNRTAPPVGERYRFIPTFKRIDVTSLDDLGIVLGRFDPRQIALPPQ